MPLTTWANSGTIKMKEGASGQEWAKQCRAVLSQWICDKTAKGKGHEHGCGVCTMPAEPARPALTAPSSSSAPWQADPLHPTGRARCLAARRHCSSGRCGRHSRSGTSNNAAAAVAAATAPGPVGLSSSWREPTICGGLGSASSAGTWVFRCMPGGPGGLRV